MRDRSYASEIQRTAGSSTSASVAGGVPALMGAPPCLRRAPPARHAAPAASALRSLRARAPRSAGTRRGTSPAEAGDDEDPAAPAPNAFTPVVADDSTPAGPMQPSAVSGGAAGGGGAGAALLVLLSAVAAMGAGRRRAA